jgi:hypothetical protein
MIANLRSFEVNGKIMFNIMKVRSRTEDQGMHLSHSKITSRGFSPHLGHPRATVARQSDSTLITLGLNSSQFLLIVIIPAIEHTPPAQIITNYYL